MRRTPHTSQEANGPGVGRLASRTQGQPGPSLRPQSAAGSRPASAGGVRGATLLETMVVASIAAIALAIGLPSYQGVIERQRVSSAMHLLSAHMASARNTAITYRIPTLVCPSNRAGGCRSDGDWSQGWLMFFDADGNRRPDLPQDILRDENAPIHPSLRIVSSRGRPLIRYLPDGGSAGSNITVRVCRQGQLMGRVIVNNLGRVRTERPRGRQPC